jgi:hypothetical protein
VVVWLTTPCIACVSSGDSLISSTNISGKTSKSPDKHLIVISEILTLVSLSCKEFPYTYNGTDFPDLCQVITQTRLSRVGVGQTCHDYGVCACPQTLQTFG